uniref:Histone acetyltransferase n=1 Tax=Mesocestoides corti TaxID=53468 RepID=A0A5K3FU50_MESCO
MREREEGLAPGKVMPARKITPGKQPVKIREPKLDDLASSVQIYQFRRAQQKMLSDKEKEVHEHLITQVKLREMEMASKPLKQQPVTLTTPLPPSESISYLEHNIKTIVFGEWEMNTWYTSMYPPTVACLPRIYICEFCLSYMPCNVGYRRHRLRCKRKFPPGNEIYRKDGLSFFEIDGALQKEYCRNLCLLAKLYLKQKTVYEVEQVPAFLFYVLTEAKETGCHIVGYFSKHKAEEQALPPATFNNLSCLLILPHYQRQGFGRMLIEFSYVLSCVEGRVGSPERPLSDH